MSATSGTAGEAGEAGSAAGGAALWSSADFLDVTRFIYRRQHELATTYANCRRIVARLHADGRAVHPAHAAFDVVLDPVPVAATTGDRDPRALQHARHDRAIATGRGAHQGDVPSDRGVPGGLRDVDRYGITARRRRLRLLGNDFGELDLVEHGVSLVLVRDAHERHVRELSLFAIDQALHLRLFEARALAAFDVLYGL